MIRSYCFRQWNFGGNVSSVCLFGLDALSPNHFSLADPPLTSQCVLGEWHTSENLVYGQAGNTLILWLSFRLQLLRLVQLEKKAYD